MKIITVASAKGGVGKSTFCCGMGKTLSLKGNRVLLVDMDIGVRSLDILLGVSENTVYNWGDVLKGNCDYRRAVIEAQKGLHLLPAPVDFCDEYTCEGFKKMIEALKKDFDYIFLDAPAGLESGFKLCLDATDSCVIISTPDAVSIRAASYAAKSVREWGVGDIKLIVNKFNKKIHRNIDVDAFIDEVGAQLLGIIPDSMEIYQFVNGVAIPENCKGNQAISRISRRICGENVPFRVKLL